MMGGAAVHGLCVRYDWLTALKCPIDGGLALGGRRLFGRNKTWRGIVAVAFGTALTWELQTGILHGYEAVRDIELFDYGAVPGFWYGLLLGAVTEAAELPTSFVKRQLGIPPGRTAAGVLAAWFFVWDQLDLLLGYWLVLATAVDVHALHVLLSALIVLLVHPLLSVLGFVLGVRRTVR